jgi:hypothetical protein
MTYRISFRFSLLLLLLIVQGVEAQTCHVRASIELQGSMESAIDPSWVSPTVLRPTTQSSGIAVPANVFLNNPFDIAPVEVQLQGLLGDGTRLEGEYVRSRSFKLDTLGLAAPGLGGADFRFEPDTTDMKPCNTDVSRCSPFDAVNVYYHVDTFVREFWVNRMAMEIPFQADVTVHVGGDGAATLAAENKMLFKVGDIFNKNAALSSDVIYHEYTHLVTRHLGFEIDGNSSDQSRALSEAYADYFAASYTDDPRFGEWLVTCPDRAHCLGTENGRENDAEIRTATLAKHKWNWNFGFPDTDLKYGYCLRFHVFDGKCKESYNNPNYELQYTWGMIWAAMLWDFRKGVGADVSDRLVLEAIRLHNYESQFTEAIVDLLSTEQALFGGLYRDELELALVERGFSIPVLDAVESGVFPENLHAVIWPNPSQGAFNLRLNSELPGQSEIRITDVSGRELRFQNLGYINSGTQDLKLDSHGLASGVYLISIRVGERRTMQKLVISQH